jgi:hypothetical protein
VVGSALVEEMAKHLDAASRPLPSLLPALKTLAHQLAKACHSAVAAA